MIDRFLQQTAQLERRTATDAYSGTTYSEPIPIQVRWFTEDTVLRYDDGREVISSAYVSTTTFIAEGDRITDEAGRAREVKRVRFNRDTSGRDSHYVGWLA